MYSTAGQLYEYEPKIWDPQAASETIAATFSSPMGSLPPWLHWEEGQKLVGVADGPSPPFTVYVIADVGLSITLRLMAADMQFIDGEGHPCTLDMSYTLQAVTPMAPAAPYPQPTAAMWPTMGYPQMAMPQMAQMPTPQM
jgi:hypothetical protein